MNIKLNPTGPDLFSWADVDNNASLIWASFAIETMLLWYFGRCLFRMEITRKKHELKTSFYLRPLDSFPKPVPLRYSNYTNLLALLDLKQFPVRLIDPWKEKIISPEGTLFNMSEIKPETDLGHIAYSCSDLAMDYFKRGATIVRCQYSLNLSQVYGNVGLNEREFRELTDMNHPDYEAHDNVGDLP